ncbi:hypothetical protein [Breznakiella homolactica]|uniref:Uncharacterized protein n=1 Tax=Breznakiella homolactica TaxID=2798577 RepID=A0A7T8BAF2_9SPIR|nr:hypothetical protein [Breznakiella homolactica]QQO08148.1 hypothetical protein JFL75_14530 [Breznakiella homolactica]
MKFSRPAKKSLILILVKRAVFFLLALCLITVFLYVIGTSQGFMDITQIILLRLSTIFAIFLAIGAAYGAILDASMVIRSKRSQYAGGTVVYLLLVVLGGIIAALAAFIIVLSGGNIP